jgi:urea transport system permease protein
MKGKAAFLMRILGLGSGALALLILGPFWLSSYDLSLLGRFLSLSLAALGLVWVWGHGGVLSLGQGIFFGLGAYALAMHLKLAALPEGELPDFMVWNGLTQLPWWWVPFRNPYFCPRHGLSLAGPFSPWSWAFSFSGGHHWAYIALITQALALTFATLLISQQGLTGGFNGLTNFSLFLGHSVGEPGVSKDPLLAHPGGGGSGPRPFLPPQGLILWKDASGYSWAKTACASWDTTLPFSRQRPSS